MKIAVLFLALFFPILVLPYSASAACPEFTNWSSSWKDTYNETKYTLKAPCKVYLGVPFTITATVDDPAYPNNWVGWNWAIKDNGSTVAGGDASQISLVNGHWERSVVQTYTGTPIDHTLVFSFTDYGHGSGFHNASGSSVGGLTVDPYLITLASGFSIYAEQQNSTIIPATVVNPPGGNPLTYRWLEGAAVIQASQPVTGTGTVDVPLNLAAVAALPSGIHTFTLEVTDGTLTGSKSTVVTISRSSISSQFFSGDTRAATVLAGTPYTMNDPAWLVNLSDQNKSVFAYKIFSALFMLGYQTEITINGASGDIPHLLALYAFQSRNGLPQSTLVTNICLSMIDEQLVAREQVLAPVAQGFQLYNHMQPLHANDISKDTLAAIYSLPMKSLPKYLQMSTYEEVQCINGQCNGFIQDQNGNNISYPVDLSADYRFVGAYFDPQKNNARLPSAAVHVQTVLHEYAHYLDGYHKVVVNDPQMTKFKIIDTTGFYAIGYDLNNVNSGCYLPRSYDPKDWITKYAAQIPGYGNCPNGYAVIEEDWAESFSMYVGSGRDFRAAAAQSTYVAQKYDWLKNNVFLGLEYDTDLVRDVESGCNDIYLYGGGPGVPAYAHCNNNYVWDFTLKPLAATIDTTPTLPAPGSFNAQTGVNTSTVIASNTATVSGINWQSPVSVSGGEYSVNGGAFVSVAGTVDYGDTVTLRQTSSASYSTRTDTVLNIGGVSSTFSVTTRTPVQPAISGAPSVVAMTGSSYLFVPTATNAVSFSVNGNLPPGLNFNTNTGALSGTPSASGTYGPIIITAINGNLSAALNSFTIEVQSPVGVFTQTGSMAIGRYQHTATLLSSGKVLIAGGYDGFDMPLSGAELYDPSTGTWSQASPMLSAHAGHSANLLPNGKVLVAGGYDSNYNTIAGSEVYDPATDSWTAVAPMNSIRNSHSAVKLANGMVLVAGGYDNSGALSSSELYDPDANTWSQMTPLSTARSYHSALLLQDGRMLAVGGYDSNWIPLASAELYDPVHNSWSFAAPLQLGRVLHTASMLSDGTVMVAGGLDSASNNLSSVERYDPSANSWNAAASMTTQRYWHTATLLNSGLLLAAGGQGIYGPLATAEVYNPATNKWTGAGPMTGAQVYHSSSLLTNGLVLMAGGNSNVTYAATDSQLFNAGITPDYILNFISGGNGTVTGVTTQKITQGGSTSYVTAQPSNGYHFVNWTGTGGFIATSVIRLTVATVAGSMTVTANFAANPVNGTCGSANGVNVFSAPAANLCTAGVVSIVAGTGPWTWSCNGTNGGTSANCSAGLASGVCGPSNGGIFYVAPSNNLCTSGTVSSVTGSGPWNWNCGGTGCSAFKYAGSALPTVIATPPTVANITSVKTGSSFTILRSEGGNAFLPLVTGTTNTTYTDNTSLKPNTIYQYAVTSDTDPTQTVFMNIRTPLCNGWNIFAVPYNTSGVVASTFFASPVSAVYEWIPTGATAESSSTQLGSYVPVITIASGKGYFAKASNNSTLLVYSGVAGPASATVTLKPGWTMIANPNTVNKMNIASTWLIDGSPLANAINANKIGGGLYWWNGSAYDSWSIIGNNPVIEPWKGYWIINLDSVNHVLTIQ